MAVNTEKKLQRIEDDILSLKATYTISGGAMKLYESVSPNFIYDSSELIHQGRIRFTVDYTSGESLIIASITYKFVNERDGQVYDLSQYTYLEPQTDPNYVDIRLIVFPGTVQVTIVTTVPGTFTRIS